MAKTKTLTTLRDHLPQACPPSQPPVTVHGLMGAFQTRGWSCRPLDPRKRSCVHVKSREEVRGEQEYWQRNYTTAKETKALCIFYTPVPHLSTLVALFLTRGYRSIQVKDHLEGRMRTQLRPCSEPVCEQDRRVMALLMTKAPPSR